MWIFVERVADQPRARLANGRKRQDASARMLIAIPVILTQIRKDSMFPVAAIVTPRNCSGLNAVKSWGTTIISIQSIREITSHLQISVGSPVLHATIVPVSPTCFFASCALYSRSFTC